MRNIIAAVALVVSLGVAGFVAYSRTDAVPTPKEDYGASEPAQVPEKVMGILTDNIRLYASQAYLAQNREEILKTLEIADVAISGDFGLVFFRYSIGSDIFREAYWTGKVDEKWYRIYHLSKYSDSKPADASWFEEMESKKDKWEEGSAVRKF